ncbi:MAG: hypothetical protein ABEK01_03030 [Candidatus Nanohaloarchaea archaeon]
MEREALEEKLEEFKDANSRQKLVEFLKERIVEELEGMPTDSDRQKHRLNLLIRDLEEEMDWIENDKLAEFDPEQQ